MVTITKKLNCLVLLFLVILMTNTAGATLSSSYHDGSTIYSTEDGLLGQIDFAVYDLDDATSSSEYAATGLETPGEGQYVYAYQIFNSFFSQGVGVAHFSIQDAEGNPIHESLMNGTTAYDDDAGGIAPDPIPSETEGAWKWTLDGGYIAAGEHSWFLVFSSENDWEAGGYEISGAPADPLSVPTPEPGTVMLLGAGGVWILARRRKLSE